MTELLNLHDSVKMSSAEIEVLNQFHSKILKIDSTINDCLKMTNLYSDDVSYYHDIEVVSKMNYLFNGLVTYQNFLIENDKPYSNDRYDFLNIEGELFFGINMFCFPSNGYDMLHGNALALLLADQYVVNIKGTQYYPLWMMKPVCEDSFRDIMTDTRPKETRSTYVMIDVNTGYYKIGSSLKPKFREKTLRSDKPTVSLLFYCDSNIELNLHRDYKHKRVRGEWFKLSKDDLLDIFDKMKSLDGFEIIKEL